MFCQYLILFREITYVPGFYKIFDEILVNAADNKQRDPKMDTIKIDIKVCMLLCADKNLKKKQVKSIIYHMKWSFFVLPHIYVFLPLLYLQFL